jgi:hypothetical protein
MSAQSRPFVGDSGEWILNTIKRNPEGLLLLAAGAVLMLRTGTTRSPRSPFKDNSDGPAVGAQMADALSDTARRATDAASSYAAAATDTARQTMDTAKSYASSAGNYAEQATRKVGEQSDRLIRQTKSMTRGVLQKPAARDPGRRPRSWRGTGRCLSHDRTRERNAWSCGRTGFKRPPPTLASN